MELCFHQQLHPLLVLGRCSAATECGGTAAVGFDWRPLGFVFDISFLQLGRDVGQAAQLERAQGARRQDVLLQRCHEGQLVGEAD